MSSKKSSSEELEKLTKEMEYIFSRNYTVNNTLIRKLMEIFKKATEFGICYDNDLFSAFKPLIYLDKLVNKTKGKNDVFEEELLRILNELEEV